MKRSVTDPSGKTAEVESNVYLNGELQYGETEFDVILWAVTEVDLDALGCPEFADKKILVVFENKFKESLFIKELGYG